MKIKGLTTLSLVDWDNEVCSTIFVGECNFRCPFCSKLLVHKNDSLLKYYREGGSE